MTSPGRITQFIDPRRRKNGRFAPERIQRFPLIQLKQNYNYNYNYKVTLFSKLFSEESCSVVGLSEQMSFQLGSELLATDVP